VCVCVHLIVRDLQASKQTALARFRPLRDSNIKQTEFGLLAHAVHKLLQMS